jgi:hypothetical protein
LLTCQVQDAVLHCHSDLRGYPYDHCVHAPILARPFELGRQLWCFCIRPQLLHASLLLQLVCGVLLLLSGLWETGLLLQEGCVLGPVGLKALLRVCYMPAGKDASIKLHGVTMPKLLRDACCSMQRSQQCLLQLLQQRAARAAAAALPGVTAGSLCSYLVGIGAWINMVTEPRSEIEIL